MKLVFTLLLVTVLVGCAKPAEKPRAATPAALPTTLFELHAATCPQCSKPILSADGTENSLCNEGFELIKEDFRRASAAK